MSIRALAEQARKSMFEVYECVSSIYGGETLPADASDQEGGQGRALSNDHSQEGDGGP